MIAVSKLNDAEGLQLLSLVTKRKGYWFWQKPKYQLLSLTLGDVLSDDDFPSPGGFPFGGGKDGGEVPGDDSSPTFVLRCWEWSQCLARSPPSSWPTVLKTYPFLELVDFCRLNMQSFTNHSSVHVCKEVLPIIGVVARCVVLLPQSDLVLRPLMPQAPGQVRTGVRSLVLMMLSGESRAGLQITPRVATGKLNFSWD